MKRRSGRLRTEISALLFLIWFRKGNFFAGKFSLLPMEIIV